MILFLAFFVLAPALDSMSCSACMSPLPVKAGSDHLCSLCFNIGEEGSSNTLLTFFASTPYITPVASIAFLDPVFSITKPPQN